MHQNWGDEGQFRFWHFSPCLWTEIASAIPECSIKSLFWLVKWPRTQKQAEFGKKGDQFFWAGIDLEVSQKNVRLGYLKLIPPPSDQRVQPGFIFQSSSSTFLFAINWGFAPGWIRFALSSQIKVATITTNCSNLFVNSKHGHSTMLRKWIDFQQCWAPLIFDIWRLFKGFTALWCF